MFDPNRVALAARELETAISAVKRTEDRSLDMFFESLEQYVDRAKNGDVIEPLEFVPGQRNHLEGMLDHQPEFAEAYAKFSLLAQLDHDEYDKLYAFGSEVANDVRGE